MMRSPLPAAVVNGPALDDSGHTFLAGIVQANACLVLHNRNMDAKAIAVYVISVLLLFAKFVVTITVQAKERMRTRHFRYPEDAVYWRGAVAQDSELCLRAQQLIRNDGESQPFYLAIGAAYVAVGAWPAGASLYFAAYALSRIAYAYFMLRPRQPQRNRAFAIGVIVLVVLSAHLVYTVVSHFVHR